MSVTDFEYLLNSVGPKIAKRNTNYRDAIPPHERLAVTLRFLAAGDSYTSLMYLFKISKQVISRIVPEVCEALVMTLHEYVQLPRTSDSWKEIAAEFSSRWNFPQCLGAIDGKHVVLQAPINTGTEYFNYKGTHSIVLLAIVDAQYSFTYVNVGCQDRISDGGVFKNSFFLTDRRNIKHSGG
ncbi:protein ANTAGONIST OF LIKE HETEROCHROMATIN PROTEIN 1-like [Sitophilus oryzae]|uniref:Protein ANTAGONIST OF LIKE HETEROCHROMATIN PROTEIN 1-like n=1 Tax=Sitophilus oryzae TaxID=7048 RepID=A0A6J2Y5C8_SITOR|nr:protein ANTAGONIST OF LIKE HETEROCHROMATIN PROTEIN 1-like [Sitophilus oryzae]